MPLAFPREPPRGCGFLPDSVRPDALFSPRAPARRRAFVRAHPAGAPMSYRATAAALAVKAPSASAKLVLAVLASYADEAGVCWPSQGRVAADSQLGLRTVRDAYRALEGAGLIASQARRRANGSRSTALVRLMFLERSGEAERRKAPGPGQGAPEDAAVGAGPEPVTEPAIEPPTEPVARGLPKNVFGEDEVDETRFEQAWAAWPEAGRETSSRREAHAAWAAEVRAGGEPRDMAAAARAYASAPGRWGRSGAPMSFHNFYARGRWEEFRPALNAPGRMASPAATGAGGFEGPDEVASALRGRLGVAGFISWTAGMTWREDRRTLVARTATAARVLADRCEHELKALGVKVEGPAG